MTITKKALIEIRDRLASHPAYAELSEQEEIEIGGDSAEFSYLVRIADQAIKDSSELTIDEYQAQRITDSARIATLESQLRAITDDRDDWVKQCSDRIDDALAFAKESDDLASEIKSLKEILHEHRNGAVEVVAKILRFHENRSEPESREIAKSLLAEKS